MIENSLFNQSKQYFENAFACYAVKFELSPNTGFNQSNGILVNPTLAQSKGGNTQFTHHTLYSHLDAPKRKRFKIRC